MQNNKIHRFSGFAYENYEDMQANLYSDKECS